MSSPPALDMVIYPRGVNFNEKNRHPRDQDVTFQEEGHIYTVSKWQYPENKWQTSVTTFLAKCLGDYFDPKRMATMRVAKEENTTGNVFDCDEREMLIDEITKDYKRIGYEACSSGTRLHDEIEKLLLSGKKNPNYDVEEYHYFDDVLVKFPDYDVVRTEWLMYSSQLLMCGALDILLKHRTKQEYIILDLKRSKNVTQPTTLIKAINRDTDFKPKRKRGSSELTKPYRPGLCFSSEPCNYPLDYIPKGNITKYSLQQNMYKYMLESKYNIKVVDMYLVILHPDVAYKTVKGERVLKDRGERARIIKVPHMPNEIDLIVAERKRELRLKFKDWVLRWQD